MESQERPLKASGSCYRYLFLINFLPIFLGILLSPQVINFIYGPEYSPASLALPWLLAAEIPVISGVVAGQFVVAAGLQNLTPIFAGINLIANLLLCFFLIPPMGLLGAAIASCVGYGISVTIQLIFTATRPYAKVLVQETIRAVTVGLATWIVFSMAEKVLPIPFAIVVAVAVFGCIAIWTKLIRREDIHLIKELRRALT